MPPKELNCRPQPQHLVPSHSCHHPLSSWGCPKLCVAPIRAPLPKWEIWIPGKSG